MISLDWRRCYDRMLWVTILLTAIVLTGGGKTWANSVDETGGTDAASEKPVVMSDQGGSEDAFFDDFDEFEKDAGEKVFDPLSGYNRVMTKVNDRLYYWVLKPVARGYRFVMPKPAREGIGNFFRNLGFPVRLVNNLLQLKIKRAGTETVRFVVNSTVGVAGLWDASTALMDLPVYSEDLGQTLGYYGLGGGFPVVLPLLGPSNVRDAFGRVGDWFLDPVTYIKDPVVETGVKTVDVVNDTSLRIGQYEAITKDSLDLYILLRDGYQNSRNKAIEE